MSHFLTNINPTPVMAEIVELANKHTGLEVEYRIGGQTYAEMDWCDAAEAYDQGYTPDPNTGALFSLTGFDTDMTPWWDEFDRLKEIVIKPLDEPILEDNYPVYQGYVYVADGKVREFIDGMNMTVGRWKALRIDGVAPVNEVRRCDIVGRQLRLPLKKEKTSVQAGHKLKHWDNSKHRRRRNSNKIKKVK